MTPITYSFLQEQGFKLLIPIVSQNEKPLEEALTIWGKEWDGKVLRLEHHIDKTNNTPDRQKPGEQEAPFYPEGLKLFEGEKGALELPYAGTVLYVEELRPYLPPFDT